MADGNDPKVPVPAGKFPRGMIDGTDEGQLAIGIGIRRGAVIMQFGKPVKWIGMDAGLARQIASQLNDLASRLDGKTDT